MIEWPVIRKPSDVDDAWSSLRRIVEKLDEYNVRTIALNETARRVQIGNTGLYGWKDPVFTPPRIGSSFGEVRGLVMLPTTGATGFDLMQPAGVIVGRTSITTPLEPSTLEPGFMFGPAPEYWANRNGVAELNRRRNKTGDRALRRQAIALRRHIDAVLFPPLADYWLELDGQYTADATAYERALVEAEKNPPPPPAIERRRPPVVPATLRQ